VVARRGAGRAEEKKREQKSWRRSGAARSYLFGRTARGAPARAAARAPGLLGTRAQLASALGGLGTIAPGRSQWSTAVETRAPEVAALGRNGQRPCPRHQPRRPQQRVTDACLACLAGASLGARPPLSSAALLPAGAPSYVVDVPALVHAAMLQYSHPLTDSRVLVAENARTAALTPAKNFRLQPGTSRARRRQHLTTWARLHVATTATRPRRPPAPRRARPIIRTDARSAVALPPRPRQSKQHPRSPAATTRIVCSSLPVSAVPAAAETHSTPLRPHSVALAKWSASRPARRAICPAAYQRGAQYHVVELWRERARAPVVQECK
jgi:hypothetical protein